MFIYFYKNGERTHSLLSVGESTKEVRRDKKFIILSTICALVIGWIVYDYSSIELERNRQLIKQANIILLNYIDNMHVPLRETSH